MTQVSWPTSKFPSGRGGGEGKAPFSGVLRGGTKARDAGFALLLQRDHE